jgi:hypothetical protein
MRPMTRAQGHANWAGNPSLCHHWMASTLRALAMLMSIVARFFRLPHQNQTAECDGDPAQTPEANDVPDPSPESSKVTAQHRNSGTTTARAAAGAATLGALTKSPHPEDDGAKRDRGLEGVHCGAQSGRFGRVDQIEQWTRVHRPQPRAATATTTASPPPSGGVRREASDATRTAGAPVGIRWGTALTIARNLTAGPPPDRAR